MHPATFRKTIVRAIAPALFIAACDRTPLAPEAIVRSPAPASADAAPGTTQLAYWTFDNGTAPTSVNGSLVATTNVTKQLGVGVSELGTEVVNFGGDWLIKFLSGVYEPTPVQNYSAYKIGLRSTNSCAVTVTELSVELEHNVVGRPTLGAILEVRNGANALLASYPFTILGGFAINNPKRPVAVPINVTLGAQNTYFLLRMNEDIWGTQSQYTAQLFMDELKFSGRRNCAPTVVASGPASVVEGSAAAFTAQATDVDGDPLTTSWDFGDNSTAAGAQVTHTYADNGTYVATATTTDGVYTATSTVTVDVTNAAPTVSAIAGATIFVGETYGASGTYADVGADTHTATVDYGAGPSPLALSAGGFSISTMYSVPGTYAVTITVTDDDGASTSTSATVTVLSAARAAEAVIESINALVPPAEAKTLTDALAQVAQSLDQGKQTAALGKLGAFDNKLDAQRKSGKIDAATYEKIAEYSRRIRASIG